MNKIATIPRSRIVPLGEASIRGQPGAVILVSDPGQRAYSAETTFDMPGIAAESRIVKVALRVERGVLGIGWLRQDGSAWAVRASAVEGSSVKELSLVLPVHTPSGKLVFDNWTEGGRPAHGVIQAIQIFRNNAE